MSESHYDGFCASQAGGQGDEDESTDDSMLVSYNKYFTPGIGIDGVEADAWLTPPGTPPGTPHGYVP